MEILKPNLSFDQWREQIIKIFCIILSLIFMVEVFIYFVFHSHGLLSEGVTDLQYIIKYIAVPTIINVMVVFACHRINMLNIKPQTKNYTLLLAFSIIAAVLAFVHCVVNSILTIFAFPVFLTILFGKKKITGSITIINGTFLLLSAIHSSMYNNSIFFYLNLAVAFTLLISAYLISSVLIAYNKANSDYAYSSYQTQLSLNEQARNDSLTGLYNQKTFHSLLKLSMEKAKMARTPMSLAIIDLDDFKEINDTFGHLAGDQVLLHFTDLMRQHCKEGDAYISRYGGDEFAVIFPTVSKELAYLRLESLRQRCRQVPSVKTGTGQISFSAGISHYMEGDINETLLFHQADSALYRAKENGKGQTAVYPD